MFKNTRLTLLLTLALALGACSGGGDARKEITEVKEVPKAEVPANTKMSTKERLGLTQSAAAKASDTIPEVAGESAQPSSSYDWQLPDGWEDRGATQMRLANVGPIGQPEVECTFSTLGGDGGGLAANLNRWRKQLSQEPYSQEEIDKLPRMTLLGQDAAYTVIDGNYGGMGGQEVKENWRLLGLTMIDKGAAYFLKMTGPAEIMAEQEEKFLTFAATIHVHEHSEATTSELPDDAATDGAMPAGHPPVADADAAPAASGTLPEGHPAVAGTDSGGAGALPAGHPPLAANAPAAMPGLGGASAGGFLWTAPEGWVKGPDKQMREVTYTVNGAECYISLLGGMAGGVEMNVNRWYGQMGQTPPTAEEIKALPTITVLGVQSPMVQIKGTYAGMSDKGIPGQMMLGVVCALESQSLFVKMTGPEDVVAAQASNFVAFCESIHQ